MAQYYVSNKYTLPQEFKEDIINMGSLRSRIMPEEVNMVKPELSPLNLSDIEAKNEAPDDSLFINNVFSKEDFDNGNKE